ncbi:MAG: hypothetical protein NTZ90_08795 [Proteobacteria bacterium]|nr:hypothetical protein [Pseudomonadota bacterium]
MKQPLKLLPYVLILNLLACGRSESTKNTATASDATQSQTAALLDDEQLAGEHVSGTVDDAIAATVQGDDNTAAQGLGLDLLDANKMAKASNFRTCKQSDDGKSAIVTFKRSVEHDMTMSKLQRSGESSFKNLSEETRTWSKDGGSVACDSTGKHVALARADLQGVNLKVDFTKEHSRASSYKNGRRGVDFKRSRSVKTTGTRNITWTKVEASGDNLILTRSIADKSEHTVTASNKKGVDTTFTTSVATATEAPLIVKVERVAKSDKLVSRTIVSGKKIATNKDGGRVETTFSNVKYLPDDGCYATSGSISGSIFTKDATTASASFTIDFSGDADNVVITYKDGTSKNVDFVAEGCAIEDHDVDNIAGATTEATSAAAVKLDK